MEKRGGTWGRVPDGESKGHTLWGTGGKGKRASLAGPQVRMLLGRSGQGSPYSP